MDDVKSLTILVSFFCCFKDAWPQCLLSLKNVCYVFTLQSVKIFRIQIDEHS